MARRGYRILKWARVAVSLLVLAAFLTAGSSLFPPAAWAARFEFLPSLLVAGVGVGTLILLVLIGRFYCSWCCPLGALQDVFAWIGRRLPFRSFRYRYRPQRRLFWMAVGGLVAFAALGGWMVPLGWLDPYSLFMRGTASAGQPLLVALSDFLYANTSWSFEPMEAKPAAPVFVLVLTGGVLLAILAGAFRRGRPFCNTFCPVGWFFRCLCRVTVYPLSIDPEKCIKCGKCVRGCKAGCINLKNQEIERDRCIGCLNCAAVCDSNAVGFMRRKPAETTEVDPGRRNMIALGILGGVFAAAGGHAVRRFSHVEGAPVMPPGALDREKFFSKCTGCQLCVANCTGKTLVPALDEYGLAGVGMPVLSFQIGRCEFNCHNCSKVCPTGALTNIGGKAKRRLRIGEVRYYESRCVVPLNHTACGACAEHCPVGALQMVPWKDGLTIPHVIAELCIGCGSCEYICPVIGEKAVQVFGCEVQKATANPADVLKKSRDAAAGDAVEDFPF